MPLQTGRGENVICTVQGKTKGKPIPVIQDPVVLIGEDDQPTWYTLPTIVLVTQRNRVKGLYSLLQRMECANPIRLGQTIVLATVDHQLWRRPLVHEVYRVEQF